MHLVNGYAAEFISPGGKGIDQPLRCGCRSLNKEIAPGSDLGNCLFWG
jgi:hypothetical protein